MIQLLQRICLTLRSKLLWSHGISWKWFCSWHTALATSLCYSVTRIALPTLPILANILLTPYHPYQLHTWSATAITTSWADIWLINATLLVFSLIIPLLPSFKKLFQFFEGDNVSSSLYTTLLAAFWSLLYNISRYALLEPYPTHSWLHLCWLRFLFYYFTYHVWRYCMPLAYLM